MGRRPLRNINDKLPDLLFRMVWGAAGAAFLICAGALGQEKAGANPFAQAVQLFEQGRLEAAKEEAARTLAEHSGHPFGLNLMGAILDQLRHYEEAETYYQKALKLEPDSPALLNNMASHYLLWDKPVSARLSYLRLLKLQPHHFNANYQLAQLALKAGNAMAAERFLARLGVEDRRRAEVLLLRARALFAQRRKTEAHQVLAQLERAEPHNPAVAFSAGLVYYENRLYRDAARDFFLATQLVPDEFEAHYNLGLAHYRLKELSPAAGAFQRALQLQPGSTEALYHLALVCSQQEKNDEALKLLLKARSIAPTKPEVLLLLGQECLKEQFFEEAIEAFQQYLAQRPQEAEVRRPLGSAYAGLRKWGEAISQLTQYLAKRPKDANAYLERSLAWMRQDRLDEAEKDLLQCLKLKPSLLEGLLEMGSLELQKRNALRAADYFKRVVANNPQQVDALYGLGRAYLDIGKVSESVPLLEKAAITSTQSDVHYALLSAYRRLGRVRDADVALRRWQELIRASTHTEARLSKQRYVEYLRRAAEANPGDLALKERVAVALLEAGQLAETQAWLQQATLASTPAESNLRAGLSLLEFGHMAEALPYLNRASAAGPLPAEMRLSLARAYSQSKRDEIALKILMDAPSEVVTSADFLNLRAQIFSSMGRYKEALEDYQRAIQLSPGKEAYYLDLITFLMDTHASEAATKALEAAKHLFPQSRKLLLVGAVHLALSGNPRQAYELLRGVETRWPVDSLHATVSGLAASFMGDRQTAAREMEKAVALGSDDPLPYYYLGLFESQSSDGDLAAGLRWAELAIAKDPIFAEGYLLRGQFLLKLGELAPAVQSLEQATRLKPHVAESYFVLSRAYAKLGDHVKAETAMQESERLRREAQQARMGGSAERQLLVRIQAGP